MQGAKIYLEQHGDDHHPDKQPPTGRLTLATSMAPMALKRLGNPCSQTNAHQDAEGDPGGQITFKSRWQGCLGLTACRHDDSRCDPRSHPRLNR